jgi:hypothetical protein
MGRLLPENSGEAGGVELDGSVPGGCYDRVMKTISGALLLLLTSCQRPLPAPGLGAPRQELTFTKLRGQEVSLQLLDRDQRFARSPSVLRAAREALTKQLSESGVLVVEGAPRTWVLEIADAALPRPGSVQRCVRVESHLERTGQSFLPAQTSTAERCVGADSALARDATGFLDALWQTGERAVASANGTTAKQDAAALFQALETSLSQLDSSTRY